GPVPAHAGTSADAVAGAELVLFCVKSTDTGAAAAAIAPHLGERSIVLSLQNGVDNAERLQAALRCEVIPAVVYVATEMSGPGRVHHLGRGGVGAGRAPAGHRLA